MSLRFEAIERDGLHAYWHAADEDRVEDQVYLDLIWRLTDGLERYAIPRYHRGTGVAAWNEPYALVDWEYDVDVDPDSAPQLDSIRDFVPARSCVHGTIMNGPDGWVDGPPSPYEAGNAEKAGLFKVWTPDTLARVVAMLQGDASAELNLFAVREDFVEGPSRLVSGLTQAEPPKLPGVLGPEDLFVDLVIGVDIGYSSVLLIQSHSDLSAKLESLV